MATRTSKSKVIKTNKPKKQKKSVTALKTYGAYTGGTAAGQAAYSVKKGGPGKNPAKRAVRGYKKSMSEVTDKAYNAGLKAKTPGKAVRAGMKIGLKSGLSKSGVAGSAVGTAAYLGQRKLRKKKGTAK